MPANGNAKQYITLVTLQLLLSNQTVTIFLRLLILIPKGIDIKPHKSYLCSKITDIYTSSPRDGLSLGVLYIDNKQGRTQPSGKGGSNSSEISHSR